MVFEDLSYKIIPTGVLNYVQAGACVYSIEAVIWACIFSITALILRLIANHLYKTASIPNSIDVEENEPLVNERDPMDIAVDEDEKEILRPKQSNLPEPDPTKIRTARGCIYVSKWLIVIAVCSIAIIPSLMSSVDIIPIALSIVINLILLLLVLFAFIHYNSRHPENPQNPRMSASLYDEIFAKVSYTYQQYPATLSIILVAGILYSICIPLMTAKACFALYSPDGTFILGPFHVSTAFTRLFAMSQVCPLGQICHIYATLPEDASTSIILNVHTGIDVDSLVASYDTLANFQQNKPLQFNKQGMSLKLDIETQGARYVHSIYLDSLTPNTDYYVNFVNNGAVLGNANFSTFPTSDSEANIVMVGGGDSSGNDVGKYFTNKIAEYDPDVIFVGGDIVYDNAGYHCYYCWDVYLRQFEQLNQKVGRLVPLILAIGNHDIGFTHNWFLSYDPYQTYFYLYFPQHTQSVNQALTIPPPEDRLSYFYHRIGNILLVSLDTGYAAESGGQQLTWLQNVVTQNSDLRKFAHYHVAILPACQYNPQKYGSDDRMSTWVPLFEDNRFMTVFENHFHLFKRTFPLKLTTDEGPGVVYAGDGGWGINPDDCFDTDPEKNITGIFQRLEKLNHVWIVNSGPDKVDYKAINLTGGVFDSYSQNIVDYA